MSLLKSYKYIFYKLYKHYENGGIIWWSEWKASLSINALCIWMLSSIGVYYTIVTKTKLELSIKMPIIWIPLVAIFFFNYFLFHHKDRWKEIIHEFDKWDKKKNRIGGWIVFAIVIAVIANLISSFYLMHQIDWTKYPVRRS